MNPNDCGTVRELIPEVVQGGARESRRYVEAHAATCDACRAELALVGVLRASRPEPRPELLLRIERSLRFDRQVLKRPWWGLTAAAVAALALGIGISSGPGIDVVAPAFALETDEGWTWDAADGLVAGGVLFDGLSDDVLVRLLEDLDNEGGA